MSWENAFCQAMSVKLLYANPLQQIHYPLREFAPIRRIGADRLLKSSEVHLSRLSRPRNDCRRIDSPKPTAKSAPRSSGNDFLKSHSVEMTSVQSHWYRLQIGGFQAKDERVDKTQRYGKRHPISVHGRGAKGRFRPSGPANGGGGCRDGPVLEIYQY